jgi:hypothetical protein
VGEKQIRTGDSIGFWCQRTSEITSEQARLINEGSSFGFFRVTFVYDDPVGTQRSSICIFVNRPPIQNGAFVKIMCEDTVLAKATTAEAKEAERQLIGGNIETQRDMDRAEQAKQKAIPK